MPHPDGSTVADGDRFTPQFQLSARVLRAAACPVDPLNSCCPLGTSVAMVPKTNGSRHRKDDFRWNGEMPWGQPPWAAAHTGGCSSHGAAPAHYAAGVKVMVWSSVRLDPKGAEHHTPTTMIETNLAEKSTIYSGFPSEFPYMVIQLYGLKVNHKHLRRFAADGIG